MKEWLKKRNEYSHLTLLREISPGNASDDYKNYYRMDENFFNMLITMLTPYLSRMNTVMRDPMTVRERLAVTLRFLATGKSFEDLKFSVIMSLSSISQAIFETCETLIYVLQDYVKICELKQNWKKLIRQYYNVAEECNFDQDLKCNTCIHQTAAEYKEGNMSDRRRYEEWVSKEVPLIGIEPVMFLYMSAFMVTSVVEEAFFVYKACSVNLAFPKNICNFINEKQYQNYSTLVQMEVSRFHQYENLASHAVPVLLAFFIGAWSDRVGRKIPLLFGLAGSLFYSLMIIVNALNVTWPVETILYTASFPCALTGASLTIFMSAFSYLSDTTPEEQRTVRITLLEVAYLTPMPLGVALGSYLFNGPLKRSYPLMFTVNAALVTAAILYTVLVLPRRTAPPALQDTDTCCSRFQVTDSFKALLRPRTERRRTLILLSLLAMALYTLQRDEKRMVQLYTIWRFNWSVKDFSNFRTFQSSFFILGLLLCVPLLQKYMKLRDTFIIMIGAASHFATRVIFIIANSPHWFYVGAVAATLGPVVAPVLRSITSKSIPASERGKVFALFSVADTTVPLLSGFVYSQTYIHTIQGPFPQAIFLVTALSQIIVFFIAIFMNHVQGGKKLTQAKEEGEEEVDDFSCN